ncbi:MAG: D-2-hydroxyacid dehydrogenase [Peptococcaceae bacterium]|nr:D-2-hydroxyacid dehydrogenase [Peptococcaceae bacterium]
MKIMTALTSMKNIGKEMAQKLSSVGIDSAEKLVKEGAKNSFLRLKESYPKVCLVHLYTLTAAIANMPISELSPEIKTKLKTFSDSLKKTSQTDNREKTTGKIYVNMTPLEDKLQQQIKMAAAGFGYSVTFLQENNFRAMDIADCEIFFGLIPPEYLPQLPYLRWFQCSFAGVNRYLAPGLFAPGVQFTNASGAYGISIAEYVVCGILMLMRKMLQYLDHQSKGLWQSAGEIRSIYGSKATVVGLGDLGQNIASRLKALGCTVQGVKRSKKDCPDYIDKLFTTEKIDQALTDIDILVLALPETDETINILNGKRIAALSPNTIVVNVGRGSALDEAALEKALRTGAIAGAVLDVTAMEPLPQSASLWSSPHTIITPHTSGDESLPLNNKLVVDIFLENLANYAQDKPLHHVVDLARQY